MIRNHQAETSISNAPRLNDNANYFKGFGLITFCTHPIQTVRWQ